MNIGSELKNKINFFRDSLLERFEVSNLIDFFNGYRYLTLEKPFNNYNLNDLISHKVLSDVLSEVKNPSNNKRVVNYYVFTSYGSCYELQRLLRPLSRYLYNMNIDSHISSNHVSRGIRNYYLYVFINNVTYKVTLCDMYINEELIVIEDNSVLFIERDYLKHFQDDLLNWNRCGLLRLVNPSKIKFELI